MIQDVNKRYKKTLKKLRYLCSFLTKNANQHKTTPLTRSGNKSSIAPLIIRHFPYHVKYIEPFFGAGGMYFNIPLDKLCNHNILNDLDGNVINYFNVLSRPDLCTTFLHRLMTFVHCQDNFNYCNELLKKNNQDPVERAFAFLIVCNYSIKRMTSTWNRGVDRITYVLTSLQQHLNLLETIYLKKSMFFNCDYKEFLDQIVIRTDRVVSLDSYFVYCDPPYIGTDAGRHYDSLNWSVQDLRDLIEILKQKGFLFAISERKTETTLQVAKEYNLNVAEICIVNNGGSQIRTEMLFMNYESPFQEKSPDLFD